MKSQWLAAALLVGAAAQVQAAVITPNDFGGPYCVSPPFGAAACGITTQYGGGGLVFDGDVAVFNDGTPGSPVYAWGGINGTNIVDLVSPVNGFFVMPGTSIDALTGSVSVEIGFASAGSLTLEVFGIGGNLLGSALNGLPNGPHGRTTATVIAAGIHSFRVSGADTWGMDQIEFDTLAPAEAVPEPGTMLLLGTGLTGFALRRRRKGQSEGKP